MTCLYRYFDAAGRLLYVGISADPLVRMEAHKGGRWWRSIRSATFEWFDTRREAMEAEKVAIKAEGPIHNVTHVDRDPDLILQPEPGARYNCKLLVEELRHLFADADEHVGASLGSARRLARVFGVSYPTMLKACQQLNEEKVVCTTSFGLVVRAGWNIEGNRLVRPARITDPASR